MTDRLAASVAAIRAGRAVGGEIGALPVAAATVVLLRPGPGGLEVLLTRRPATMAFAPNLHVFPGGRVDPADGLPDRDRAPGLTADEAARRLAGTLAPAAALAHHVAATRETLEETGIQVHARDLVALTRWVTPESLPRRFDVRFFAAAVPPGTDIMAPSSEVASSRWLTPEDALREAASGALEMLLPTLVTFQQLVGLADIDAVAAAFAPGSSLDGPAISAVDAGLQTVDQRWAGGIAGRAGQGWLVGHDEVVLVDPADPTGETTAAVDAALAERGARLVGIALTGQRPEQHAGTELYAAGRGLRVAGGAGGHAPYPVEILSAGEPVPFGDVGLVAEASTGTGPASLAYRLDDGRLLPPRLEPGGRR